MLLRVGQGQGAAPGPAEHGTAVDPEVGAQGLDVRHQVPGRVVDEGGVGRALAAASLVEEDDAPGRRIEEPAVLGLGAPSGPPMEEHHRLALGVSRLLEVEVVHFRDAETPRSEGLDLRIEDAAGGFHGRLLYVSPWASRRR
jgi:hypothetical protein